MNTQTVTTKLAMIEEYLHLFCCPHCRGDLSYSGNDFVCSVCLSTYSTKDGIPQLFCPNDWDSSQKDVTEKIKSFYEKTPFPNYEDFDDVGSLIKKSKESAFADLLDEQVPFGAKVLECGCGTGQLSNFLSISGRRVFGTDLCMNSLRLGDAFKEEHDLETVQFLQMNLFRPCFKEGSFDLVISNGVLHHTADPFLGFQTIAKLVKPKGYILIGLYHYYGRLMTDFRRLLFRLSRDRLAFLDYRLRSQKINEIRKHTWFMDQYKNPHESKHTIEEAIGWVRKTGFRLINTIPKTALFEEASGDEDLFTKTPPGGFLEKKFVEMSMALTHDKEGGFFIIIAQRPGDS